MAKVLIVDDNAESTKLLEKIIKGAGYISQYVLHSKECIPAILKFQPDLILLDIMMPHINGITICKFIKSDPNFKKIPVLIVSSLTDADVRQDCLDAGANDFLAKPISSNQLLSKIKALI